MRRSALHAGLRRVGTLGILLFCACRGGDTALERGDRFWADSSFNLALAEYRLAADQVQGNPNVQARVAHAYAQTGQLDRAREQYNLLLKVAPEYTDQAVFDYLAYARAAGARADRYGLARAVEAALELRAGIEVGRWAADLASYYAASGDAVRALEYLERALAVEPEASKPRLLFEIASVHDRRGDCGEAASYYRSYIQRVPFGDSAADARFRVGSCAFELGRRARDQGDHEAALHQFDIVVELGSPPNLLDQAWFERGEGLMALGRYREAAESFRRVLDLTAGRSTQLSARAQRRLIELGVLLSRPGIGTSLSSRDIETAHPGGVYAGVSLTRSS